MQGKQNAFIFFGDHWGNPLNNTYDVLLPIKLTGLRSMEVRWHEEWNLSIFDTLGQGGQKKVHRLNIGGPALDTTWETAMIGSNFTKTNNTIVTGGITGAAPAALYQTCSWGANQISITSLVPNSPYTVSLHFAEWYWTAANQRKFHIDLNGKRELTDFDIFATAGGNKAVVKTFDAVSDAGGSIIIGLIKGSADESTIMGAEAIAKPGVTKVNLNSFKPRFPFQNQKNYLLNRKWTPEKPIKNALDESLLHTIFRTEE